MRLLSLWSPLLLCASLGTVAVATVEELLPELELSPPANVYLRGENGYTRLAKRWQVWRSPDFAAVVEVATAEDVAKMVCHLQPLFRQERVLNTTGRILQQARYPFQRAVRRSRSQFGLKQHPIWCANQPPQTQLSHHIPRWYFRHCGRRYRQR